MPSPKVRTETKADTRGRILDAALELFNERGSANVTTNHIAEALGISPGNLYYHFRNKAGIVRELFARIIVEWAETYALPTGKTPSIGTMASMAAGNFDIQWRYRFFFRDLTMLLAADEDLASEYRSNREAGMANTVQLLKHFVKAGLMTSPGDDKAFDEITQLLWLIGDFWLVFKDAGGKQPSPADMDQGVRMFRRILAPYTKGRSK
jgi:AcrR family transcriptional regulator